MEGELEPIGEHLDKKIRKFRVMNPWTQHTGCLHRRRMREHVRYAGFFNQEVRFIQFLESLGLEEDRHWVRDASRRYPEIIVRVQ